MDDQNPFKDLPSFPPELLQNFPIFPFNPVPDSDLPPEQMMMNSLGFPPMDPNWLWMLNPAIMPQLLEMPFGFMPEGQNPLGPEGRGGPEENVALGGFNPLMTTKKIGPLTVEERNLKIQRFREKRARRNYGKKVSYECRKKVADGRVRVKGRFISKEAATEEKKEE